MGQFKNIKTLLTSPYSATEYDQVIKVPLSTIGSNVTIILPDISTENTKAVGYGWELSIVNTTQSSSIYTITVSAKQPIQLMVNPTLF